MSGLVRVLTASEPWAEYQLEDGTLLRFRFTACSFRLTGKKTDLGDPEYSFSQQIQVETYARPQAAAVHVLKLAQADRDTAPSEYVAPDSDCG